MVISSGQRRFASLFESLGQSNTFRRFWACPLSRGYVALRRRAAGRRGRADRHHGVGM